MRTMTGNQIIEVQLEEQVDNFPFETVCDYIMGTIVIITIITCLILNGYHIWGMIFQRKVEKAIKKEQEQTKRINRP